MILYENYMFNVFVILYKFNTGKPPPGSRNQYLPALLVDWLAGLLVYRFAGLPIYWFTGLLACWIDGLLIHCLSCIMDETNVCNTFV